MNIQRVNNRPAKRPRWPLACSRLLLCTCIAGVLSGWNHVGIAATNDAAATADAASGSTADFDRSLLAGAGQNTTDLSRFEHGNPVTAGTYRVDIFLNNNWVARRNVRFASPSPQASAVPCVDRPLLDALGLHPSKLSEATLAQLKSQTGCVNVGDIIPDATASFDLGNLRLDVSIPQAYLGQMPRGYVAPQYWDAGVTAALLNYNFNTYRNTTQAQSQTSSYLGLNSGLNLGPWHFRENATVTWQSAVGPVRAQRHWQNINAYLQRDIPAWRSLLTLGDSYTDGAVFDSYGIRGVQLGSDDRMLPQSLQGYAPLVHGVANTNARVTVRQNGVLIYETTVAPGPFSINDLYPTGYGGSLDVTVAEADGRLSTFSVPYASVAQLLRPGITRFDIAAGQMRQSSNTTKPPVLQATAQHGFSNLLTGYAGLAGSRGYAAALMGTAINTRFGAVAFDITGANAHIPGYPTQSGQSMRVTYSKVIPSTQTTLSVAAYRYSTGGFLSLSQAELARDYARRNIPAFDYAPGAPIAPTIDGVTEKSILNATQQAALTGSPFSTNPILSATGIERQRNNFSLTLNQRIGHDGGSLYANASASNYWNRHGTDTQFQIGYNNHFHRLTYSISATRSVDQLGRYDNEYLVSFSIPLGDSSHAPNFTLNLTHDQSGASQDQALLTGTLGSDSQFNYGATMSHGNNGSGNAGSVNLGYRSPYAIFNGSYGKGSGYSQASAGVSGAIVVHPGGVTFGQPTGDTIGVVYVPNADGARLNNSAGASVDRFGYALVPYLTPYSLNTIQIDPKGLPLDVQLDGTSQQIAPYAGAVVMLKFKTESGRMLIVHAQLDNGQPLPFGAEVLNSQGVSLGAVGQAGQILVRGVDQSGTLTARWQDDDGASHSCSFAYRLASKRKHVRNINDFEQIDTVCKRLSSNALAARGNT